MARKRAPGAGRPPRGDINGKTETFTTRITPETRRALEASARKHGRSLSQEAEVGLREYLKKPDGFPRNRALASLIRTVAEQIEAATKLSWTSDTFTSMALRYAVEAVLADLAPGIEETPTIPPAVETRAAKWPPEIGDRYRRPAGLGHMQAYSVIMELRNRPRPDKQNDEWTIPIGMKVPLEMLGILARDLDLD
jgi:plasmid stability protein